jgi:hypothetical protein
MVNECEKSRSNQAVVRPHHGEGRNLPVDDYAGGIGCCAPSACGCDSEIRSIENMDVSRFVLLGRPGRDPPRLLAATWRPLAAMRH